MKPANTVAPNSPAVMASPPIDSNTGQISDRAVQGPFRSRRYHSSHFPRAGTKRSPRSVSFPGHSVDGRPMEQIFSTLMLFAKDYSTPIGILLGMLAFD